MQGVHLQGRQLPADQRLHIQATQVQVLFTQVPHRGPAIHFQCRRRRLTLERRAASALRLLTAIRPTGTPRCLRNTAGRLTLAMGTTARRRSTPAMDRRRRCQGPTATIRLLMATRRRLLDTCRKVATCLRSEADVGADRAGEEAIGRTRTVAGASSSPTTPRAYRR